jgi:hypothetical protein
MGGKPFLLFGCTVEIIRTPDYSVGFNPVGSGEARTAIECAIQAYLMQNRGLSQPWLYEAMATLRGFNETTIKEMRKRARQPK